VLARRSPRNKGEVHEKEVQVYSWFGSFGTEIKAVYIDYKPTL
jgi:hypothetical protein